MNPDHSRYADWDSAYVLGALAPGERREYEEHLETCETCRRSVAELAPMPGLLARLSADRAEGLLDERPAATGSPSPELLDAVRREARRRSIRRLRTRIMLAAAAAVVVLAALVAVPLAVGGSGDGRQSVAFETVGDLPLSATAVLTSAEWGTRIQLDCTYESGTDADPSDGGWPYSLVVVDRDGGRTEVSNWRATPGSTARLEAASALAVDEIASLEIRAVATGDVLLRGDAGR